MKRLVLLILALLLVADLAEDGCLGKAMFVPTHSSARTSLTSLKIHCTGKVDSLNALPSPNGDLAPPMELQPVTLEHQPILKIVLATHIGSSGGIPL